MTNLIRLKQIESGSFVTTSSLQSFTESIDARVDSLEFWSSSIIDVFATDLEVAVISSSIAATIDIISQNTGFLSTSSFTNYSASQDLLNTTFATTGSNEFVGDQIIDGYVTASSFEGGGRYLTNLSPSTNWNYSQEYSVSKTEQLTFSGDYILEDTYLLIEGGVEQVQYSLNKYFNKFGSIFIGGNLLVKNSYIQNDGLIHVGGEVILIGNSQIVGTGKII
jgi:hypothetical protein